MANSSKKKGAGGKKENAAPPVPVDVEKNNKETPGPFTPKDGPRVP